MNNIVKAFFSIGSMILLLVIFAIASGSATIIEAVYGTETAWEYVYKTNWFALIMLLLVINLIYNIYKYKMYLTKKLPSFIFHLSFIMIFIGAATTRYFGFEGSMHIREGDSTNLISTRNVYIQLMSEDKDAKELRTDVIKYIATKGQKPFNVKLDMGKDTAVLTYKDLVLNADIGWVKDSDGHPVVELLFSDEKNKKDLLFLEGYVLPIADLDITFNAKPKQDNYIEISLKDDGKFYMKTNQNISYFQMSDTSSGVLPKDSEILLDEPRLYTIDGINFSFKTLMSSAKLGIKPLAENEQGRNAILADLSYNGETKEVFIFYSHLPRTFEVGGEKFNLAWSPKFITLPFSLELKKFKMDRYPGSNSPSGYSSEVVVKDKDFKMPYEIFMNNVLDYGGFRFFQSSYDLDEHGTILSVNRDPGKVPTYVGYFLLMFGMFLNFFNKNSRFLYLARKIDESSAREKISSAKTSKKGLKNIALALSLILFSTLGTSQLKADPIHEDNATNLEDKTTTNAPLLNFPSYKDMPHIDKEHANQAKTLIVQGFDGRMQPFDTIARDILTKIYNNTEFNGMNYMQVVISMSVNPEYWRDAPFIKVSEDELKNALGIPLKATHAKFDDFFNIDSEGKSYYKLSRMAEVTHRKPPNQRDTLDKDIIKVDERFNIYYATLMKSMFKIIPKENDPNNAWFSPYGVMMEFTAEEALRARIAIQNYFSNVIDAQESGDWTKANEALDILKSYQLKVGNKVAPSINQLKFEVIFNQAQIFQRLMPIYLIAGFALLILVFMRMMSPNLKLNFAVNTVYIVNITAFIIHTIGLGLRWYISGHAPWSNTYESLVYIAWALSLSGVVFSRTSAISLSLTSIMAGITLFVAHLSAIDPQITPLQPVLNSYWLTIHVSVITASYGFFGLSALLGAFVLFLFIIKKPGSLSEISRNITETCHISEMSLILGLCLLSAGNFLGGIWANESWGRYWGWDSKETWSFVTILIYAAIVHFRFVPKLNSQYTFSVASMWAFFSVLMTYFGVNFYLTGMHSYAGGESIPIPTALWVCVLLMLFLTVISFFKRKDSKKL
ncbi:MAG: cytochrome c biogenesis protein CcsA [Campylobacter sp.]|nr:cytochrome c biogenesis protein CcsA [Campylobacter sp.]